ncbi:hypothetical protein V6N12_050056 [Hibiscus sabdariffa]|uniref:Uncharacterized protein n=1 Tax=Hibiscus sabdariffa TaxID=183260 RepID=A0ABR2GBQ5_9ROSI
MVSWLRQLGTYSFHDEGGSSSNVYSFSDLGDGLTQGGSTLKEDHIANIFINELFEYEYVDLRIDGSATVVPYSIANDSGINVVVGVLVDSGSVLVDVVPTVSVVDSTSAATTKVVAATVTFVVGADGGPTNPTLVEFH